MPFLVYGSTRETNARVNLEGRVPLAGRAGPLAAAARAAVGPANSAKTWTLSEDELLQALRRHPTAEHLLVIDLKPSESNKVSLYRILRIWGHSYAYWTPVALRLRPLFVDRRTAEPSRFKRAFRLPARDESLVHEFLYLQGGYRSQPRKRNEWQWGRSGSVNAALLWPDALSFFLRVLQTPESDDA